MKGKILVTINLILILLAITGFSYSHWSDTTNIQGTVKIAHIGSIIDSEKVLNPTGAGYDENNPIGYYVTPDNLTLIVTCQNVTDGWRIAIGLLIHNIGTIPVVLKNVSLTFQNAEDIMQYFNITTYFYGPFPEGTNFNDYWDGTTIDQIPDMLPTAKRVEPPIAITLNHCEHAISWTLIGFNTTDPTAEGRTITIRATPEDDPAL